VHKHAGFYQGLRLTPDTGPVAAAEHRPPENAA
jgi:hypothetical protein